MMMMIMMVINEQGVYSVSAIYLFAHTYIVNWFMNQT